MEAFQDSSAVKERSQDQRDAQTGEPVCTICGRYGEYICDQSDRDICSLQCKSILLSTLKPKKPLKLNLPNTSDECLYIKSTNMLTKSQVSNLRNQMDISVKGENVPDLIVSFSDLNLEEKLENNIELAGFVDPTPVQMQAIPCALNARNLLVSSFTGSGKTASYLIPIIYNSMQLRLNCTDSKNPLVIVIAPTRELCVQIEEQARVLAKGLDFKTALCVGGDSILSQINRFNKGIELIVGTPGRLIDIFEKFEGDLSEISILVLDEGADLLSEAIRVKTGLNSISIHGEKTMKERREKMKMFLTGEVPVLVSTGVLGRGMDMLNLNQVIIFDLPDKIEEYLHQIGRASRRGEEGNVMLFLNWEDKRIFGELVRVLRECGAVLPAQLKGFRGESSGDCEGFKKKRKVGFTRNNNNKRKTDGGPKPIINNRQNLEPALFSSSPPIPSSANQNTNRNISLSD
ncbi:hypothetical protein LUZ60_006590 [Juncus effusus]|nr:hypothetical protein LUZ60_006590 [Juncus effusus]